MISNLSIFTLFEKYTSSYKDLPLLAWQGIFVHFIEAILVSLSYFLTLYLINEKHYSISEAGIYMSYLGLGTIFGSLFGGKLSDKWSAGYVGVICLILQGSAYLALTTINSNSFLIITLFFLGAGSYGFITSSYAWVLAICENNENYKIKVINLLSIASNLGFGLAALLLSIILTYEFKFLFVLSSCLLYVLAIYFFILNKKIAKHAIKKIKKPSIPMLSFFKTNHPGDSFLIIFILIGLFLGGFIISQMNSTYPIYIKENVAPYGIQALSILFAINTFMVVFFQAPIVDGVTKFNHIKLVSIGILFLGLGMATLCLSTTFLNAVLGCIIHTIGEIILFSFSQLICYERVHELYKGHILGIYRMVFASSRMIGPAVGGMIYQSWSGEALWLACLFLGILWIIPPYFFSPLQIKEYSTE